METTGLFGSQTTYQKAPKAKSTGAAYINFAKPGAGELSREEFKQALTEFKDKGSIPEDLKEKFDQFIEGGYVTYFSSDNEASDLYRNYVNKQVEAGDAANIDKLIAQGSGFHGHITTAHKNTTAALLLDYVEAVRRDGVDKAGVSPELAQKLYDPKNGFGITSSAMQSLKNNSDPLVKGLFEIARKLGLNTTIRKTREEVINGERSDRTKDLPTQIINGILQERFARNDALLPTSGSMVIAYDKNNRPVEAEGFTINSEFIERTGGDKSPFKEQEGKEINYREFFENLVELQIKGDNDTDRNTYVMNTLTAIFEHYDYQIKNTEDPEAKEKLRQEEKAVARNLTGRGLISMEKAAPVVAALRVAGVQKEVTMRLAGEKLTSLAEQAVADFRFELTHGVDAQDIENSSIGKMWDPEKGEISLFNSEFTEIKNGLNGVIDNVDMTKTQQEDKEKITIETALDSYIDARKNSTKEVIDKVRTTLTGEGKMANAKQITDSEKQLNKTIQNNTAGFTEELIISELTDLVGKGVSIDSTKEITKALKKFMAHLKSIDVSALDKKAFKNNQPLEEATSEFAKFLASATKADTEGNNPTLQAKTDAFFAALKAKTAGEAGIPAVDKTAFLDEPTITKALTKTRENKDAISKFFNGIRMEVSAEDGLTRILDLEKLSGFVKTNSVLKEQAITESNKSTYGEIEQAPSEAGPLLSLIYKKDDSDPSKNDHSANLTGTLGLISKLNGEPAKEKAIDALVQDLYKNDNSISTEANAERRMDIAKNLLTFITDKDQEIKPGRSAIAVPLEQMANPNSLGALNNLRLQLEANETDSLAQIKGEIRQNLLDQVDERIAELQNYRSDDLTEARTNYSAAISSVVTSALELKNGILDKLSGEISKLDNPSQNNFKEVKTKLQTTSSLIREIKADVQAMRTGPVKLAEDKAEVLLKINRAQKQVGPAAFKDLAASIESITAANKNAVATELEETQLKLEDISMSLIEATTDIAKNIGIIEQIRAEYPVASADFTEAVTNAATVFDKVANTRNFSNWLNEVVLVSTEREKFLAKAHDIMSARAEQLKGWYAGGFISLYSPAEEAEGTKADNVELLKRMQEHDGADDPVKAFKEAISSQTDEDSKRIHGLFEGLVEKQRDVHAGPNMEVQHSKSIFQNIVAFVQNFVMNRNLLASTSGVGTNRYYPEAIRKRIEASGGAAAQVTKPTASPKQPDPLKPASNEDKATAAMN